MGIEIIRRLGKRFLWLTHTGDLLRQTQSEFLKLYPNMDIGLITEGQLVFGKDGAIATVQTLSTIDINKYKDEFDLIMCDECAHVSGSPTIVKMFSKIVENIPARFKYGLTATPSRSDTLINTMYTLIGMSKDGKFEPTYKIDKSEIKTIIASHNMFPLYTKIPLDSPIRQIDGTIEYNDLINFLSFDEERNKIILGNIAKCQKEGRKQVVLASRKEHVSYINKELKKLGFNSVEVTGSTKKSERKKILIEETNSWEIVVSTYSLFKEGINIKELDTLHFAVPQKDKALIVQSVGRIERFLENKKQPMVFDYVDVNISYCLHSYNLRKRNIKNRY